MNKKGKTKTWNEENLINLYKNVCENEKRQITKKEWNERDVIKKDLLFDENVTLIKLSIFQISPSNLWGKIGDYTHLPRFVTLLKFYDKNWSKSEEVKEYKRKILEIYGKSDCMISPYFGKRKTIYM